LHRPLGSVRSSPVDLRSRHALLFISRERHRFGPSRIIASAAAVCVRRDSRVLRCRRIVPSAAVILRLPSAFLLVSARIAASAAAVCVRPDSRVLRRRRIGPSSAVILRLSPAFLLVSAGIATSTPVVGIGLDSCVSPAVAMRLRTTLAASLIQVAVAAVRMVHKRSVHVWMRSPVHGRHSI
jgi:hypothetical protein